MTKEGPILPEPTPINQTSLENGGFAQALSAAETKKKTGPIQIENVGPKKPTGGRTPKPIVKVPTLPLATDTGVDVEIIESTGPVRRMGQGKFILRLQKVQRALSEFDPETTDTQKAEATLKQIEDNLSDLEDAVSKGKHIVLIATNEEKANFISAVASQKEILQGLRRIPNEQPEPRREEKVVQEAARVVKEKNQGVSEVDFVQRTLRIETRLKELSTNPETASEKDLDALEKALIEMKADIQGKGKQTIDADESNRKRLETDLDAIYAQLEKIHTDREELRLAKLSTEKRKEVLRKKAEKVAKDIDYFLELQAEDDTALREKFTNFSSKDLGKKFDTSKIMIEREAVIKNIKLITDPSVNIIIDFDGKPTENDTEQAQVSRRDAVVADLERLIVRLDGMEDEIHRLKVESEREEAVKKEQAELRKPFQGVLEKTFDFEKIHAMGIDELLNQHGFAEFIATYDKRNRRNILGRLEDSTNETIATELQDLFGLFIKAKETGIQLREIFKKEISNRLDDHIKLPAEAYNSVLDYVAELAYNGEFIEIENLAEHIKTAQELPEQIAKQEEVLEEYLARMGGMEAIQKDNDLHVQSREKLETLKTQSGINSKAEILQELFENKTIEIPFIESDDRLYLYAGGEKTQNKYLDRAIRQYDLSIEEDAEIEDFISSVMNKLDASQGSVSPEDIETLRQMRGPRLKITDQDMETLTMVNPAVAYGPRGHVTRGVSEFEVQKNSILWKIKDQVTARLLRLRDKREVLADCRQQKTAPYGESRKIVKQLVTDKELHTGSGADFIRHWFQRIASPRTLMKKAAEKMHRAVEKEQNRLTLINRGIESVEDKKEGSKRALAYARHVIFGSIGPAKNIEEKVQEAIREKVYGKKATDTDAPEENILEEAKNRQALLDRLEQLDTESGAAEYEDLYNNPDTQRSIDAQIQKGIEDKIEAVLNSLKVPEPYTKLENALFPWIQKLAEKNEKLGLKQGEEAQRLVINILETKIKQLRANDPRKILVAGLLRKLNAANTKLV